mmetsp:Transcript_31971/g.89776  ORF Transcript_31971/g.89776 Transcript_31971/m.89776 type:complete len:414 (-) Transcript_31971:161-1402(-)
MQPNTYNVINSTTNTFMMVEAEEVIPWTNIHRGRKCGNSLSARASRASRNTRRTMGTEAALPPPVGRKSRVTTGRIHVPEMPTNTSNASNLTQPLAKASHRHAKMRKKISTQYINKKMFSHTMNGSVSGVGCNIVALRASPSTRVISTPIMALLRTMTTPKTVSNFGVISSRKLAARKGSPFCSMFSALIAAHLVTFWSLSTPRSSKPPLGATVVFGGSSACHFFSGASSPRASGSPCSLSRPLARSLLEVVEALVSRRLCGVSAAWLAMVSWGSGMSSLLILPFSETSWPEFSDRIFSRPPEVCRVGVVGGSLSRASWTVFSSSTISACGTPRSDFGFFLAGASSSAVAAPFSSSAASAPFTMPRSGNGIGSGGPTGCNAGRTRAGTQSFATDASRGLWPGAPLGSGDARTS